MKNIGPIQARSDEAAKTPNIGVVQTIPDPAAGGGVVLPRAGMTGGMQELTGNIKG